MLRWPASRDGESFSAAVWPFVLALCCIYTAMAALWGTSASVAASVWLQIAAGPIFLAAWWKLRQGAPSQQVVATIVAAAVLMRLPFLFVEPRFSDDLWRYIWEGQMWFANPFAHPPASPLLAPFRSGELADIAARINHPELPAIYPPGAQFVFIVAGSVLGTNALAFKLFFLLLEMLAMGAIAECLRAWRLPRERLALYAWNPLVVVEVAGNAHFDFLVAGALALGFWAYRAQGRRRAKGWRAGAAWGAGAMTKLLPAALIAYLFGRRLAPPRRGARWALPLAAALIVAAYHARFFVTEERPRAFGIDDRVAFTGSLGAYAVHWERNGLAFQGVRSWVEWIRLDDVAARLSEGDGPLARGIVALSAFPPSPPDAIRLTKIAIALGLLVLAAWLLFVRPATSPEKFCTWLFAAALLLSPILYPWYLILLFPMILLGPMRAWLWLCLAFPLTYLAYDTYLESGFLPESPATLAFVFIPFYVFLAVDLRAAAPLRYRPESPAASESSG